jgi:ribonuclease-3
MKSRDISALEEVLDHQFSSPELLQQALTHSSHAREAESRNGGGVNLVPDNEQLEFLGDAVLGFVTSQELFQRFPQFSEGELSKLRAYLVSEKHLIRAARHLQIGRFLRLGHGEEKSGGRSKTTLLVDALEAVVAAMYLDAGLQKARALILDEILEPELERMAEGSGEVVPVNDFKSSLQETAHSMGWSQPAYVLVQERGPEHQKTFTVEARVRAQTGGAEPEYAARGEGPTKKQAEQGAAKKALEYLRSLDNPNPKSARSRIRQPEP